MAETTNLERANRVASSVQVHDVSKFEKHFFYFNIRGDGQLGPKLVYRSSEDKFTPPAGPENDPRSIRPLQLLQVEDHAKLGKDNQWATIRDKVRDLLDIAFCGLTFVLGLANSSRSDGSCSPPSSSSALVGTSLMRRASKLR